MEYYLMKRKALALIRKLAERGIHIDIIELTVLEQFGFGKAFVRSYLNYLEGTGALSITKSGEITWHQPSEKGAAPAVDPEAEADAILGRSK
jgi:DNA-binding transcriptional regulator PaaX